MSFLLLLSFFVWNEAKNLIINFGNSGTGETLRHYSFPGWRHYILITNLYFVFEFLISFFNVCIFTDCVR